MDSLSNNQIDEVPNQNFVGMGEEMERPMTSSQQTAQRLMANAGGHSEIGTNSFVATRQPMDKNRNLPHRDTAKGLAGGDGASSKAGSEMMIGRDMKSPNFFQMSGIPKFGKNWLDNFIPDEEM